MGTSAFRNLIVWQKAINLSERTYSITALFPKIEQFCLVDQMRRASISIASNIAEGSGRGSNLDYARFLSMARGSCSELETQTVIAGRLGYISDEISDSITLNCEEIQKILSTLIQKYKG